MKKRPGPAILLMLLAGLACIGMLLFFSFQAHRSLTAAETGLTSAIKELKEKRRSLEQEQASLSESIAAAKNIRNVRKQTAAVSAGEEASPEQNTSSDKEGSLPQDSAPAASDTPQEESGSRAATEEGSSHEATKEGSSHKATEEGSSHETTEENTSRAATEEGSSREAMEKDGALSPPQQGSSGGASVFSISHTVGIDPGHQSYDVDMSSLEPLGPGSSEMKPKASEGTQGTYSGLPEYQLNLDVSLKLRDILESRGYQVTMTRTDNETAISNKERAQYVAEMGAEIYVHIHANGEDTHTASGALGMVPSPDNPFAGGLSAQSQRLSQCILDSYCSATGFKNRGVQYYDNMTGINWSSVPVTILEMGFMTCESDDLQMSDASFQDIMAEGIADGIDAYFEDARFE